MRVCMHACGHQVDQAHRIPAHYIHLHKSDTGQQEDHSGDCNGRGGAHVIMPVRGDAAEDHGGTYVQGVTSSSKPC